MVVKEDTAPPPQPGRGLMYEALAGCEGMEELSDGYALRYEDPETWGPKLAELERVSGSRWPALSFAVTRDPQRGEVRLEIRGPEGTKGFIESANEIIHSHLNPAPSVRQTIRWKVGGITSRMRVLPDFLIFGAKKCGTTSLYWYLTQHPKALPAYAKELNFFNYQYGRGIDWYRRFFPTVFEKYARAVRGWPVVTGEATPDYIFFPAAAARIAEHLPDVRLIALLRNPVDRAYSAYHHRVRLGVESRDFADAVREEIRRDRARARDGKKPGKGKGKGSSYLEKGDYGAYLRHWYDRFPSSRILVLRTEDMARDPAGTANTAFEFLGLEPYETTDYRKQNAAPYPPMAQDVREELIEFFRPKNERLYERLGTDLSWED